MRWLVLGSVAICATAHAQPNLRHEAAEHFARGEAAQAQQRYREAIAEYEQAYAAVPHANALFNIAFCYEQLAEWARGADYYQRYLDADRDAADAIAVGEKIKKLRTLAEAARPLRTEPPSSLPLAEVRQPEAPIVEPAAPSRPIAPWHLGVSYGLGFGETPVERYLARAGVRLGGVLDADAIAGAFGKNDYAVGIAARVVPIRGRYAAPFARAALTIGYAKQDASSSAMTKLPIGFEVGGGILLGGGGAFELDAVVRWVRGGWDSTSTTAESYANDAVAFAVDLGFVFDVGLIAGAK